MTNFEPKEFSKWLAEQMERRGMTQSDLARATDLTTAAISNYIRGKVVRPDTETLHSIARGLDLPVEEVYREAGILPPKAPQPANYEELEYWFTLMTPEEQELFLEQGRLQVELRKRREQKHKGNNDDPKLDPIEKIVE